MIHIIVPVSKGTPDIDWENPPIQSFQINDTQRYCMFKDGVEIRSGWVKISEAKYNKAKPKAIERQSTNTPIIIEGLQKQINLLGQGLAKLMLGQGGGA